MKPERTKSEIEQERKERARRQWLKEEKRRRPRTELPTVYEGESIHVHQRIYDGFMKQVGKKLVVISTSFKGGAGGKLIIHYETRYGGHGTLELFDLGPMPAQ